jgi:hypothetical protein
MVEQVLQHHSGSHAPADQVDPVQSQGVHQRGHVVGPVAHTPAGIDRQRLGVAVTAQVDGQSPVPAGRGERQQLLLPEEGRADVAVDEQHRLSRARRLRPGRVQHGLDRSRGLQPARRDTGQQDVGHRFSLGLGWAGTR